MPAWTCLCAVTLGAGCYVTPIPAAYVSVARPVTIGVPPPSPQIEQPAPEPYAGAVWLSGYWDWRTDQSRYVWVPGRWGAAPRPGVAYLPPSWRANGNGGFYRVPGRWVVGPTRDSYGRHIAYDSLGRPYYF